MITKIYHSFQDKQGNKYSFTNYLDFAQFWLNTPYRIQINFSAYTKLQRCAANSKEARTKA